MLKNETASEFAEHVIRTCCPVSESLLMVIQEMGGEELLELIGEALIRKNEQTLLHITNELLLPLKLLFTPDGPIQ